MEITRKVKHNPKRFLGEVRFGNHFVLEFFETPVTGTPPPPPWGKGRNCPERALFGPIGAFRAKPPFAKPSFGLPRSTDENIT